MNQPTESEFLDDVGLKKPDRSKILEGLAMKVILSVLVVLFAAACSSTAQITKAQADDELIQTQAEKRCFKRFNNMRSMFSGVFINCSNNKGTSR